MIGAYLEPGRSPPFPFTGSGRPTGSAHRWDLNPRRVARKSRSVSSSSRKTPCSPIDLGVEPPPKWLLMLPRKEVIQPHLPVRLPCYDFVPIAGSTLDGSLLAVRPPASGVSNFHDVTGGVYKARERIHRSVLTCGY